MPSILLLALMTHAALVQEPVAEYPSIATKKTLYAKKDLRGKAAPKVEVEQWLSGKPADWKGKTLILDFWATWCPPCRATIPELNEIQKKFAKDVVVVGLSSETPEVVKAFMEKTEMSYAVALDSKSRTSNFVGVDGIPHVLIVSPDGIVRWQGFPLDGTERLTADVVAQIVKASKKVEKPAPVTP